MEKIGLLGHLFGVCLALYYTLTRPQRVRELYLVAGAVTREEFAKNLYPWFITSDNEATGQGKKTQAVYDRYNRGEISADESFREVCTQHLKEPSAFLSENKRAIYIETFARTDFTYLGDKSNFTNEPEIIADIRRRMPEISCPTLLMPGQLDVSAPLEFFGDMARKIKNAEVAVIPCSRHFPFIDEPEVFCDAIRAFRKNKSIHAAS